MKNYKMLVGKHQQERRRGRWKNNTKRYLAKIDRKGVDCIHAALDKVL
jgi:hypothetical protein